MTYRDIHLPATGVTGNLAEIVESTIVAAGNRISSRGTLATYPHSKHWHVKRGDKSGTLEVTWWPDRNRLWLTVHANRHGDWIGDALELLAEALERTIRGENREGPTE